MITTRQLVDWFTRLSGRSRPTHARRVQRRFLLDPLENRTSQSHFAPSSVPAAVVDQNAASALVMSFASCLPGPDGGGKVGPKDPGGVDSSGTPGGSSTIARRPPSGATAIGDGL
jgi:hypothetical protein